MRAPQGLAMQMNAPPQLPPMQMQEPTANRAPSLFSGFGGFGGGCAMAPPQRTEQKQVQTQGYFGGGMMARLFGGAKE